MADPLLNAGLHCLRPTCGQRPTGRPARRKRTARLARRQSYKKECTTKRKNKLNIVTLPACLPKLVAAEVVAESTRWSVKHVYRLAQQGLIPHYRIHGSVRFDPQEIADWLQNHRIAA